MSDTVPVKPLTKRGGGSNNSKNSRQHRRGGSSSSSVNDEEGSLTYSAASSASVSTAGGESTDSSFADIMRVLDKEDSAQLEELMKKEGMNSKLYKPKRSSKRGGRRSSKNTDVSVASSLNYSTDGESAWANHTQATEGSHLNGEQFLQTIPGQPSDSAFDGGGGRRGRQVASSSHSTTSTTDEQGFDNSLFAEADPVAAKVVKSKRHGKKVVATKSSRSVASSTNKPPVSPERRRKMKEVPMDERSDAGGMWYAKWWMCGFADALQEGLSNFR